MNIFKVITSCLLTIIPIAVLIRDWKFHDKRTKEHHKMTQRIIIFWIIGSVAATVLVWIDSAKIDDLVNGENTLITQNKTLSKKLDIYQRDLIEKQKTIDSLSARPFFRPFSKELVLETVTSLKQIAPKIKELGIRLEVLSSPTGKSRQQFAAEMVKILSAAGITVWGPGTQMLVKIGHAYTIVVRAHPKHLGITQELSKVLNNIVVSKIEIEADSDKLNNIIQSASKATYYSTLTDGLNSDKHCLLLTPIISIEFFNLWRK